MKNSKKFWQFFYDTRDKIFFTPTQAKDKEHNFCEWEMENKMKWKGKMFSQNGFCDGKSERAKKREER